MKLKKEKVALIILLSVLIVITLAGMILGIVKAAASDTDGEIYESNQIIVEGNGSQIVESPEDAYNYFEEHAGEFGIKNPEDTIAYDTDYESIGYKYYNYRQVYEGIPVYGNRFVVMTNSDGIVMMSSGEYNGIDSDIDLTPAASKDDLVEGVTKYFSAEEGKVSDVNVSTEMSKDDLVIYPQDGGDDILAYEFEAVFVHNDKNVNYHVIADADSGEIISTWDNSYTENVIYPKDADKNNINSINVFKETENQYYMYDGERNLLVCNADAKDNVRIALKSNFPKTDWRNFKSLFINDDKAPLMITSQNNEDWDSNSVAVMNSLKQSYDWYEKNCAMSGYDKNKGLVLAYYNDSYGVRSDGSIYGANAYSSGYKGAGSTCLSFGYEMDLNNKDLIAHEYSHSVQREICNMNYEGETGAIMEAYADTMGEIIEGDTSWKASVGRDIASPGACECPFKVNGDNYESSENKRNNKGESENDNGNVHHNSTVLSYASALMNIGDSENSDRLSMEQIGKLWTATFGIISSEDIGFQEFGECMVSVARCMAISGDLDYRQYFRVIESLNSVGINASRLKTVYSDSWVFYDFYKDYLDEATVTIYNAKAENNKISKGSKVQTIKVNEYGELKEKPRLNEGKFYLVAVKDETNDSKDNTEMFYIEYLGDNNGDADSEVSFDTGFRANVVKSFEFSEKEFDLAVDEKASVATWIHPYVNSKFFKIKWESSDSDVVSVDKTTGIMIGVSEGTAVVKATLTNNGKEFIDEATVNVTKKQRDTILVLDHSGSMYGQPIREMKKAACNFCSAILERGDNRIEIIIYDDTVSKSGFLSDIASLENYIDNIRDDGGTNMYDALELADEELSNNKRDNSIQNIVIMSDGAPNQGSTLNSGVMTSNFSSNSYRYLEYGNAICQLSDSLKSKYNIYSLGFFHQLRDSEKDYCSYLMNYIQNEGYYEVVNADDLIVTFDDISTQVKNGSKIVINIACPVDVSVTYGDETLSSSNANYNGKTSFGMLEKTGISNEIKTLELDSDKGYNISIQGTGDGTMDYSIDYYDENDSIVDSRKFNDVPINVVTVIDTITDKSHATELNIDSNGDGEYDTTWTADENDSGKQTWKADKITQITPIKLIAENNDSKSGSLFVLWIVIAVVCGLLMIACIACLVIIVIKSNQGISAYADNSNIRKPDSNIIAPDNNAQQFAGYGYNQTDYGNSNNVQFAPQQNYNDVVNGIMIIDGEMSGVKIPIEDRAVIKIGKDSRMCDIVVDSKFANVSRFHCTIEYSARYNKYFVTDCSSNGTFESGSKSLEKGKRTPMNRGTVLNLATNKYRIRLL